MTDPNSLAIFAKVVEASSISGPGLGLSRIETGERSGGIRRGREVEQSGVMYFKVYSR
jgi:hypothetical protein